ncbi:MAG TPA: DUF6265 family protein [Chitinophagaceae bacterium]|nr:DUF6265 family protein [Chitinophagaceae bacterium]
MRRLFVVILIAFSFYAFTETSNESKMQSFKWLEGSWTMKKKNGGSIMETWLAHNDSVMLGESMSFSVTGQSKVLETLKLAYRSGNYYYISRVNEQNKNQELAFRISSHSEKGFVAEKHDHDFPKRITYEMITPDSIHAFIDGGPAMPGKRSDFYYSRYKN